MSHDVKKTQRFRDLNDWHILNTKLADGKTSYPVVLPKFNPEGLLYNKHRNPKHALVLQILKGYYMSKDLK